MWVLTTPSTTLASKRTSAPSSARKRTRTLLAVSLPESWTIHPDAGLTPTTVSVSAVARSVTVPAPASWYVAVDDEGCGAGVVEGAVVGGAVAGALGWVVAAGDDVTAEPAVGPAVNVVATVCGVFGSDDDAVLDVDGATVVVGASLLDGVDTGAVVVTTSVMVTATTVSGVDSACESWDELPPRTCAFTIAAAPPADSTPATDRMAPSRAFTLPTVRTAGPPRCVRSSKIRPRSPPMAQRLATLSQ